MGRDFVTAALVDDGPSTKKPIGGGSLSRCGERGRLADELSGRLPLAGPLRTGGITDGLSPGQLSTRSLRSQLGYVDLGLHLSFPGLRAREQHVTRLKHSLGQVLGVWFVEQPDVPIFERIRLPPERIHLLGKHLVRDAVMSGELHAQPLQGPKLGLQCLPVLLMESILTHEERGLGWTRLGLQPNKILIGRVHTRHLVLEGLPVRLDV